MNSELKNHYDAVLRDLQSERTRVHSELGNLQRKIKELDFNIATLARRVDPTVVQQSFQNLSPETKYAHISVRWAILDLLHDASGPMATADIADALKKAGVKTRAANFTNNVSAVLSTTMKGDEEVEVADGKWKLTEKGWSAIRHIRSSPKFRRSCPWADLEQQVA
jgi:NurA-like 5'-3' nuclease